MKNKRFKPDDNVPSTVYGPPDLFEQRNSEEKPKKRVPPPREFSPAINMQPTVYGPPEMIHSFSNMQMAQAQAFDPSNNNVAPIYGPPQAFGVNPATLRKESPDDFNAGFSVPDSYEIIDKTKNDNKM